MAAYGVVLPLVLVFGGLDGTSPSRFVWALLPMIPALGVVRAVWRHVSRLDEYQRALLTRSLAIGFGVMAVTAVTLGFLEIAGLHLAAGPWIIYGLGMSSWLAGTLVNVRTARG
jgi:hypothetical protein